MLVKELLKKLKQFDENAALLAFDGMYHSPVVDVEEGPNPFLVNLILGDEE